MTLSALANTLRQSLGLLQKQDIQIAARHLGQGIWPGTHQQSRALLGDDCAAIPDGDSYLLLAAEGLWPVLVETEPWFAGWCAVMVNISDIYAMGGRPIAVVDALWSTSATESEGLWAGMTAASKAYGVPIVGGHSNYHSPYQALAVAILGRATHLLSSFNARPGDVILMAIDRRGKAHPNYPFWNAATGTDPQRLRDDLEILPTLAEAGLCDAAKDISMGGLVGTLLMFLEASGCGATLDLTAVNPPDTMPLEQWLLCFPSFGFLLSVRPHQVEAVRSRFYQRDISCEAIAQVQASHQLTLHYNDEEALFWDLSQQGLTGFSISHA